MKKLIALIIILTIMVGILCSCSRIWSDGKYRDPTTGEIYIVEDGKITD